MTTSDENPAVPRLQKGWWVLHGALAILTVLALLAFSSPIADLTLLFFAVPGFFAAGLGWFVLVLGARRTWRAFVGPAVVVALLAVLFAEVPRQVRWAMSRPAFDELVAAWAAPAASTTPATVGWSGKRQVGAYEVITVSPVVGGYVFILSGGGFSDDTGFAYLPSGPSAALEGDGYDPDRFHPLGDHWYVWFDAW
ncbi:hypothetical protein [Phytomonospora endophytica]|uniref:Uncharacterized protein n=1 Tax=Phytomonospora endophytica TaxID=714109 RepID=A0A841FMY2_9ACTN|nr:hypothetical protein [Phytomonospora endophytica]MBB6036263.1 hypothetical protein [Phytomonospora endophytica]GIG67170.1 hypothetical protein Pen01_34650 [Phytomonospora endophytica]